MLLTLAPYVFGTLLLLVIFASFWTGGFLIRAVSRRPDFRVWGWVISVLFFAPLLFSAVIILRQYHDFAFSRHLDGLIEEARFVKGEDGARNYASFAPLWQARYEDASLDKWVRYGDTTARVLKALQAQRNWFDCNALLRDSNHHPEVRAGDLRLVTRRVLSLHALAESSRRDEKNFEQVRAERAFSRIGLRVLNSREASTADLEAYVFLHFGVADDRGTTRPRQSCRWGVAMYEEARNVSPAVAASFL
ncbi:MAG: hypothetical protein MPJ79_07400, partial [Alphaproteobacteria bacterium]|nr:hypothetical protein [Alphaproteobacteria bacterium]MDA7983920.1 hypothetical protein [Alphaproteobacteria bacterium]MDA8010520.1 hypothetical protein [Alphaproteobacteria bacterium]MDA8031552.1 hypothetical protein [Alphaproteobacteria bacterium]